MNDPTARMFGPDSYDFNPYSNPENCGLTLLATLEDPNASYDFDTIIFVKDNATGGVYGAHSAGCSCPTPFEEVNGLPDMTPIRTQGEALSFMGGSYVRRRPEDVKAALEALEEALS